jgi:hypothetical protein
MDGGLHGSLERFGQAHGNTYTHAHTYGHTHSFSFGAPADNFCDLVDYENAGGEADATENSFVDAVATGELGNGCGMSIPTIANPISTNDPDPLSSSFEEQFAFEELHSSPSNTSFSNDNANPGNAEGLSADSSFIAQYPDATSYTNPFTHGLTPATGPPGYDAPDAAPTPGAAFTGCDDVRACVSQLV